MTATKQRVSPRLVNLMTSFYGSVEAAREAYAARRQEVRDFKAANPNWQLLGGRTVLWVADDGCIDRVCAAEVFYDRSPDAAFVLPCD